MADLPITQRVPLVISSISEFAAATPLVAYAAGSVGSSVWPSANRAIFVPFWLPSPFVLRSLWWANGTPSSNNTDAGIYLPDGKKLVSTGSTAASGTNALQIVSVTEMILSPGPYYMALANSNTAGTIHTTSGGSVTGNQSAGVLQADSQLPLADGPTFASPSQAYIPIFGIASLTSGF